MNRNIIIITTVMFVICSCKKSADDPVTASLSIVNAIVGSNPVVVNFSNEYSLPNFYANALKINYGVWNGAYQFGAYSGFQPLRVYQMPDTTSKSTPFFDLNMELPPGSIQTLFLIGTVAQHEILMTSDTPPYHPDNDSTAGIRFINLSPGSDPVNVTLSTSTTVNEFANIAYKGVTGFKNYATSVSFGVTNYTFQVRNGSTNDIIASQTFSRVNNPANNYRFRNFTIALIGQPGGTGSTAQKVILINNY